MASTTIEEKQKTFETYRFYLDCINNEIVGLKKPDQILGIYSAATTSIQGFASFDEKWIDRWMKIAWNTEYISTKKISDPFFARINNQWKPIQSYYCAYAASEAAAYLIDGKCADGHDKALAKMTDFFISRKVSPWDKAFKGARGKNGNGIKVLNFPFGIVFPSNLKRNNIDGLQMIGTCLKAEHKHRISDKYKRKSGILKYEFDPGNTGLLHFLYRLRIKSNYKDATILFEPATDGQICNFNESLDSIIYYLLMYLEIKIMRKCKKEFLIRIANDYLSMNPQADRLKNRLNLYR